ncbi:MAG: hypothetical protein LBD68_08025, partial [Zoogloeaceae bacterium]|nr:hypothetical protein [Zoogloeaceae bacterium]
MPGLAGSRDVFSPRRPRAVGLRSLLACCLAFPVFSAAAAPEHHAWCEALGKRLRSVNAASCRARAFTPGAFRSVEGRPLMLLDAPPKLLARPPAAAFLPPRARLRLPPPRPPGAAAQAGERPRQKSGATRILLIGGIHGDELTSVSIVFR